MTQGAIVLAKSVAVILLDLPVQGTWRSEAFYTSSYLFQDMTVTDQ
jgi:hypothetical protein